MKFKSWLQKNHVFLWGAFMAILGSAYELFSNWETPEQISWWVVGWTGTIALLTYFGRFARGQVASVIQALQSQVVGFFTLHDSGPQGITQMEVILLIMSLGLTINGIFFSSPMKSIAYEKSEPIIAAKEEAKEILKDEKR